MNIIPSITWGDIATIATLLTLGLSIFWRLTILLAVMREFPPHRHINNEIVYPKGLAPDKFKGGSA